MAQAVTGAAPDPAPRSRCPGLPTARSAAAVAAAAWATTCSASCTSSPSAWPRSSAPGSPRCWLLGGASRGGPRGRAACPPRTRRPRRSRHTRPRRLGAGGHVLRVRRHGARRRRVRREGRARPESCRSLLREHDADGPDAVLQPRAAPRRVARAPRRQRQPGGAAARAAPAARRARHADRPHARRPRAPGARRWSGRCGSSTCPPPGRGAPHREVLRSARDLEGDAGGRRWDGARHAHHRSPQRRTDRRHRRRSRRHRDRARSSPSAASTVQVLEASDDLGGQWHTGAAHSGIWPGMRANTSGAMTRFSDRPTPRRLAGVPDRRAGPRRTARPRRADRCRRAHALRCAVSCRRVRTARAGPSTSRTSRRGASTRCASTASSPRRGASPCRRSRRELRFGDGVEVIHSSAYRGPARFAGRRVLVVGNSISGLEIASDLAHDPTITVVSSSRRPRWIIPKLTAGVPADHVGFTAFAALLGLDAPARGARRRAARAARGVGRRSGGGRRPHPGAGPPGGGPEPEPALPAARRRGPHRRAPGHRARC